MSQEEQNQQKALGCLAIIVLGLIWGIGSSLWDWVTSSNAEMIPYTITIDLNSGMTNQFVLGGTGCNLDGNYEVIIRGGGGSGDIVDRKELRNGRLVENVFCRYTITGEVPRHSRYSIKVETHVWSGDPDILGKGFGLLSSEDRITETLRWHHPRDN